MSDKKKDKVLWHTPLWGYVNWTVGQMPPDEEFFVGDVVEFKSNGKTGIVVAKFKRDVEYEGLSVLGKGEIVPNEKYPGETRYKRPTVELDFYTIQWFSGAIRTAGAHMTHQIKRLGPLTEVLKGKLLKT